MTTPQDANDVLMGGGCKSAEFHGPGTTVGGPIVAKPRSYQVREYQDGGGGPLAYFPSGDPIMGLTVDVKTNDRDPADPADDGTRRIYLEKARQLAAVRLAVRAAGATGIEQGGYLALTETGTEPGKGSIDAKTYTATYRPPSAAPVQIPGGPAQQGAPAQQPPTWSPWGQTPATGAPAPQYPPQHQGAPMHQGDPWATPAQAAPVQATPAPGAQVITETVASAMRNAGIDTTMFTVVPG